MRFPELKKLALIFLLSALPACNLLTNPETYFDRAVLNTNLIGSFCGSDIPEFRNSTAVLVNGKTVIMPRKELLQNKIKSVEDSLQKVKNLPDSQETHEMTATSIQLHELVLDVYRNDYGKIADLYDRGASPQEIEATIAAVHAKYCANYEKLAARLTELGKAYAEKHNIKVQWGRG